MATKMCFFVDENNVFAERIIPYTFFPGMSYSQKQKNILSFHSAIKKIYPNKSILEVSTKSNSPIGVKLSAFNLTLDGHPFESIFQSSKVFETGEQYAFLAEYEAREAKHFIANQSSGKLKEFRYKGQVFPLLPRSLFYDYIYTSALFANDSISRELIHYDVFTDIEFNEKKQINCQARSCAIYAYMLKNGKSDYYLQSIDRFKELYTQNEQLSIDTSLL